MENREIRRLAWERLFKERWIWKLFGAGLLLENSVRFVLTVLSGLLTRLGVVGWLEHLRLAGEDPLTTPVPGITRDFISMAAATGFEVFIVGIMAGIIAYGTATVLIRCLAGDSKGWLGAAFRGFKIPLELFALMFRLTLIWLGWAILSIPTLGLLMVIPFYRYRFLWLVKAEHPELSTGECLRLARRLTDGNKRRSFRLDCSYWKSIALVLVLALLTAGGRFLGALGKLRATPSLQLAGEAVFVVALSMLIPVSVVVGYSIHVGQGLLYRELTGAQTPRDTTLQRD